MTETTAVLLVLLGLAIGAFGTLVGSGGGFILTPLLLLLYPGDSPEVVTSISLAVVFFNALSGSIAYARMRRIDFHAGVIFGAATVPGAILGALATRLIARGVFDIVFGILLVLLAAYLGLRNRSAAPIARGTRSGWASRSFKDSSGQGYEYSFDMRLGVGISIVVGFISSFLGIGGGVVHVPLLIQLLGFPAHIATATSHFILVISAFTGTVIHVWQGDFREGFAQTALLAVGVILGAQVGARLATRVHGLFIVRALALALALVGIRLALNGAGII